MKNKKLIILIISVFLVLVSCKSNAPQDSVNVFSNGKTSYTIITADGASDETAELAEALSALSGAGVLTDTSDEKTNEILIGDTARAVSGEYVQRLKELATVSAFHFIVAEKGGKLIILADADIGYIYALEHIKKAYIDGDTFTVPVGAYDMQRVFWDEYYASDRYNDRLLAEADKNHYDDGNKLLDNEIDRYGQTEGNTIMTIEQAIERYKNMAAGFNTADFGEYDAVTFTSVNKYNTPGVLPGDTHPRVLFTKDSLGTVESNLAAEENSHAYKRYMALSDIPCDGKFKALSGNMVHNYDADMVSRIEAKAFRYVMERDPAKYPNADDDPASLYGYEAIYAAKNAMLTINVPHTVGDWCRTYGFLMYVTACVYDWCYDLLTDTDKTQIINGTVNLLGKHLEMVCYAGVDNKVPTEQGAAYGHGAEDQLLVDYLSFAIACYNEAPEIYNFVAGRIFDEYVDMQNYLFAGGSHWEGSMYGGVRSAATVMADLLFNRMTGGDVTPFNIEEAAITSTHIVRPDGQRYRIGDMDENYSEFSPSTWSIVCFYASSLYGNSYLKDFAYESLSGFDYFKIGVAGLTPVQFLAANDTSISHVYEGTAPLTRTAGYPGTSLFAKSANDDRNAFGIYMTMPESFQASHAHMECGSFQIYYKGSILASDSGAYAGWGSEHHMSYSMSTVASNSLLIYNPALAGTHNSYRPALTYTGGQSVAKDGELPNTLSQLLNHERLGQCTSLGVANAEEDGVYLYSYMGGDMTKAYDYVTVGEGGEVTRYMFAVATGDAKCPYAFLTFDRITAADASYHKSALIHVQEAPKVKDGFAFITNSKNGGSGKLVVQSVGYDTEYTVIGGEGREFWIPGVDENGNYSLEAGKNLPSGKLLVEGSLAEYGWGRIEISPAEAEKTNRMLTVMYVTDAANNSTPVKAESIVSDNLAGACIFGKAVMFPEDEKLLTRESSFTLTEGGECYIAGVAAGEWNIMQDGSLVKTVAVKDGTNLLTFTAEASCTYTLMPVR